MAYIELNRKKLRYNYKYLDDLFRKNDIKWGIVTKLMCGNETFLREVLDLGIKQVGDSRVSNLKMIKKINPEVETMYIKPPPRRSIKSIVRYADISFNTEYTTIKVLSEAAIQLNKTHKIIIMIELGELREGVMRDDLIEFYGRVFELPNIEIIGLGTNLTCLSGVLPSQDKMIQLSLYKQLIEARFNKKIPLVSGGSSVTIPLILENRLPAGINHFRVGETLFFGNDIYHNVDIEDMQHNLFHLYTEVIELSEKPVVPDGELGENLEGESISINEELYGETTCRAIIDLGLLDVDREHMTPVDESIEFAGASSDVIVLDLGDNKRNYKVGDLIEFNLDYLGVLKILNSEYIDKKVV